MRKFCCALLALLPLSAFAYPIDVEKELNGASVDYTTYATDYDIGAITLNNFGDTAADCTVVFRNGPESPRTRRIAIDPKKSADLSAKFNRKIIKLRIAITCRPK